MKARCGLEDCDCEYTIGKLLGMTEKLALLAETIEGGGPPGIFDWLKIRDEARRAITEAKGCPIL